MADDTAAIQAAVTAGIAACGTVVLPPPAVTYKVTNTINILPSPALGTEAYVNLVGAPMTSSALNKLITWAGPNSTPLFSTRGWRVSSIQNIGVTVPGTSSGTTVWDIDTTASAVSSTGLDFRNCPISFLTNSSSGFGWRLGASGLTNDISAMSWYDCQVYGAGDSTKNHVGWQFDQANAIGFHWYGGLGYYLNPMIKINAGEDFDAHGLSGTHNAIDFQLNCASPLTVLGGRFEFGGRLLDVAHNTTQSQNIFFVGTKTYNATATGGILIRCLGLPILQLDNMMIINRSGADYGSQLIWHHCDGAGQGSTLVRGGVIQAPYPFAYVNAGSTGTFRIKVEGTARVTNAGVYSATVGKDQANALTYGATIATDANLSDIFTIAATNTTAFTISNPTNPFTGRTISYDIKNSSGGVMGAITWGAAFLLAGAFTNPANGKRRTISFYYDGTNWVETNRAAADI